MYSKVHAIIDNYVLIYLNRPISMFYGELNIENDLKIKNYDLINNNLNEKFLFWEKNKNNKFKLLRYNLKNFIMHM